MEVQPLGNWPDLARLVHEHARENWIYRGVTQCDHELVPNIGRKDARKDERGRELPFDEDQERLLLGEFRRQARPMVQPEPNGDLEWMAVAQHTEYPGESAAPAPLSARDYFAELGTGHMFDVALNKTAAIHKVVGDL